MKNLSVIGCLLFSLSGVYFPAFIDCSSSKVDAEKAAIPEVKETVNPEAIDKKLGNGFYLVVREGADKKSLAPLSKTEHIILNDGHFLEKAERNPPAYIVVNTRDFIPITLSDAPKKETDDKGKPKLNLQLATSQIAPLEEFSRTNLGRTIAIVVDGQVVTCHKIKAVITGGKIQITRCSDSGCTILYSVLSPIKN